MENFITQEVNGMTVSQLRCRECGNQITIFIDNSQRNGGRTGAQIAANA
jgi:ribosomal protein S27E